MEKESIEASSLKYLLSVDLGSGLGGYGLRRFTNLLLYFCSCG
jgi:hypothetical protein